MMNEFPIILILVFILGYYAFECKVIGVVSTGQSQVPSKSSFSNAIEQTYVSQLPKQHSKLKSILLKSFHGGVHGAIAGLVQVIGFHPMK
jgi:hypothetical protein